jgi:hypothetical protein
MKLGAFHYVTKPFGLDEIVLLVEKALETTRLRRELRTLRGEHRHEYGFDALIGTSAAMQQVRTLLARVAASPVSTVLLTGETGTGKDLAAKTIHFNSGRAGRSLVNITCSALPEQLLESELFGHERGAFTDARQQKRGLLEMADSGTVFLDEIGEMTAALQSKLLRCLEEKTFKRVGGLKDIRVDVRVIAATNRDLQADVKAGKIATTTGFCCRAIFRKRSVPSGGPGEGSVATGRTSGAERAGLLSWPTPRVDHTTAVTVRTSAAKNSEDRAAVRIITSNSDSSAHCVPGARRERRAIWMRGL